MLPATGKNSGFRCPDIHKWRGISRRILRLRMAQIKFFYEHDVPLLPFDGVAYITRPRSSFPCMWRFAYEKVFRYVLQGKALVAVVPVRMEEEDIRKAMKTGLFIQQDHILLPRYPFVICATCAEYLTCQEFLESLTFYFFIAVPPGGTQANAPIYIINLMDENPPLFHVMIPSCKRTVVQGVKLVAPQRWMKLMKAKEAYPSFIGWWYKVVAPDANVKNNLERSLELASAII